MRRLGLVICLFLGTVFSLSSTDRVSNKPNLLRENRALGQIVTWDKTIGRAAFDVAYNIRQTVDGGFILGGLTYVPRTANESDLWLIKLTLYGDIEWQKSYGGDKNDGYWWVSLEQTLDGGFIVLTDTASFGAGRDDLWVLKLNAQGDVEWQKTFGGSGPEHGGEIYQTKDGGYIVAGSLSAGNNPHDFWVFKLNSQGEIDWQKVYDGFGDEEANSIHQTPDGGFIVSGSKRGYGPSFANWVLKLTPGGDIQWQREIGIAGVDPYWYKCHSQTTPDGGCIFAGYTNHLLGAGLWDFLIVKLSSTGAIEWQKTYGGPENEAQPYAIKTTQDGGYIVAGLTSSFRPNGSNQWDGYVLKLDAMGEILWQKYYGSPLTDWIFGIQPTSDGGYVFVGGTRDGEDIWIQKIDANGAVGPCDRGGLANGISLSETLLPVPTAAVPLNTMSIPQTTAVVPLATDAVPVLHCWNLNQPPENLTLVKTVNRSLLAREYYYHLSWSANSYNNSFDISEYRIYRKESSGVAEVLAHLPPNVFQYYDGPVDSKKYYSYWITTVDSQGHESPKSAVVRN